MNIRTATRLFLLLVLASISCKFGTQLTEVGSPVTEVGAPANFTAEATSPMSVKLTWPAGDGVEKYLIDARIGEQDFIPIGEATGDQTTYEVFPVPDNSQLTFRLQAVTSSGTNEVGTANVTTPEVTPNPLAVQANQYEPITWEPPTPDPDNPIFDPSSMYPPGFDPSDPESFDPSALIQQVSASADIGADGGEVTITTPDQITYTLSIPAGALDDMTTITLVPIQTIDGLPFSGGLQGAVRIEPEGVAFDFPAKLTIALSEQTPSAEGLLDIGFAFESDGTEFHLQPISGGEVPASMLPGYGHMASLDDRSPLRHPLEVSEEVDFTSYYGWTRGTKAEARKVVEKQGPSAKEDRMLNELALVQLDKELIPLGSREALATMTLLERAIDARTMIDMASALETFETLIKLYGNEKSLQDQYNRIWDLLLEQLYKLLKANKEKCLTADDAFAQAFAERLSHAKKGTFSGEMAKRFKDKYGDAVLKEVQQLTKNCVLELKIDSKITGDTPPGKLTAQVTGTIPLKFTSRKGKIILLNEVGSLEYKNIELKPTDKKCKFIVPSDGHSVKVNIALEPIFAPRTGTSEGGALQDFKLSIISAVDSPVLRIQRSCPGQAQFPLPKGSLWYGYYTDLHMGVVSGWKILDEKSVETDESNHPIYARKISDPEPISAGYGTWLDNSIFVLSNNTTK